MECLKTNGIEAIPFKEYYWSVIVTAQKMKFTVKDFFSKCDQIRRKLRIWSHLLKKSLMENFIFCKLSSMILSSWNGFRDGPWIFLIDYLYSFYVDSSCILVVKHGQVTDIVKLLSCMQNVLEGSEVSC